MYIERNYNIWVNLKLTTSWMVWSLESYFIILVWFTVSWSLQLVDISAKQPLLANWTWRNSNISHQTHKKTQYVLSGNLVVMCRGWWWWWSVEYWYWSKWSVSAKPPGYSQAGHYLSTNISKQDNFNTVLYRLNRQFLLKVPPCGDCLLLIS